MKRRRFWGGLLLLVGLLGCLAYLTFVEKAFTITTITCTINQQPCPSQLNEQLTTALKGKPLFLTDFKRELAESSFHITEYTKRVPGHLFLAIEPYAELTVSAATTTNDPEQALTAIKQVFTEADLAFDTIETRPEQQLAVVILGKEQALLRLDHAEEDSQKVVLIKKHLRLAEIDTGIVEIDARYQMPVLRTTKSSF
jgi:hypothetical protein